MRLWQFSYSDKGVCWSICPQCHLCCVRVLWLCWFLPRSWLWRVSAVGHGASAVQRVSSVPCFSWSLKSGCAVHAQCRQLHWVGGGLTLLSDKPLLDLAPPCVVPYRRVQVLRVCSSVFGGPACSVPVLWYLVALQAVQRDTHTHPAHRLQHPGHTAAILKEESDPGHCYQPPALCSSSHVSGRLMCPQYRPCSPTHSLHPLPSQCGHRCRPGLTD